MVKQVKLSPKYLKALQLLEDNTLSIKDIAAQCGIATDSLYELHEGRLEKWGPEGKLFYEKIQELGKRKDKQIRDLVKKNKILSQRLVNEYLGEITQEKNKTKKNKAIYQVTKIVNALAKSTPNVEIGSFTYQKGLSPEDIYAEFKRLSGLTLDRSAVQGASTGRAGEIPVAPRPRTAITEEPEDPIL